MVLSTEEIGSSTSLASPSDPLPSGETDLGEKNQESLNNLCRQYEEKVRPCIDLIDSLRALGVEQDLALPAIAVIGDQSSGKSSVLEALSGVALPRGSGIVTRCPLVLKLKKLEQGKEWRGKVTYDDFEMELSDPSEVEDAINNGQNWVAGKGLQISDKLISLDVSSPNVPDLTLIDLPGITRVAVGNQPVDIGHQPSKTEKALRLLARPTSASHHWDPLSCSPSVLLEDGKATVPLLAERLTTELISHICKSLPLLENQIKKCHQTASEELQKYGADIPEDDNEKTFFLIEKINTFNQDITAIVQGEENVEEGECRLFNRIRNEFLLWSKEIEKNFQNGYDSLYNEVWKFEKHYRGRELPGFVNYKTFETIIRNQIKVLEEPAVDMLHRVTGEYCTVSHVSAKNFAEFFNLHRTTKSKLEDIRLEQEKEAEKMIRLHFQMEQIIYCQDQLYRGALKKVRDKEAEEEKNETKSSAFTSSQSQASQNSSMDEIFQHLNAYRQEAHNRISSHIPLIIQYFILKMFADQLQKGMLQLLQNKDSCGWLLKERNDTSEKRKFLKKRLSRLAQARRQLAKFPG
nr:interferon-induced GTP-binding protein Mx2-like [Peromyscus maniculatus bairdii]